MAKSEKRLTALQVSRATKPGLLSDGGGLYLNVSASGSKSWLYRYMLRGKAREMGLRSYPSVSLEQAREARDAARKLKDTGIDPIEARDVAAMEEALRKAREVTFRDYARTFIEARKPGWKNAKHAAQWEATLETYAHPTIGDLPVAEIDTQLVLKVLRPIWTEVPETAARVRGRIEAILDAARAEEIRQGENPARWKGRLDKLLPARRAVQEVEHHSALPYADMPAFWQALKAQQGMGAQALQFAILTAARSGEVRGARWSEIDFDQAVWTIPGARMKARALHRVPLAKAALNILEQALHRKGETLIFPGAKEGRPLSDMTLTAVLRRMKRGDLTAHGFRSTFSDWCAEQTAFPREVAEMALAHTIGNKVEAAYRRGDLFEKRRRLMDAWASFCLTPPAQRTNVTPIKKRRS